MLERGQVFYFFKIKCKMHFCASSCGLAISQCDSEPLLAGGGAIVVPYVRLFLRQVPRGENTHQVPWENTLQILREI